MRFFFKIEMFKFSGFLFFFNDFFMSPERKEKKIYSPIKPRSCQITIKHIRESSVGAFLISLTLVLQLNYNM